MMGLACRRGGRKPTGRPDLRETTWPARDFGTTTPYAPAVVSPTGHDREDSDSWIWRCAENANGLDSAPSLTARRRSLPDMPAHRDGMTGNGEGPGLPHRTISSTRTPKVQSLVDGIAAHHG